MGSEMCIRDSDSAISSFKMFVDRSEENRSSLLKEAQNYEKSNRTMWSALRYSALSMPEKSAPMFFKRGYYEAALKEYRVLEDKEGEVQCLIELEHYYEAANELEKLGKEEKWEEIAAILEDYIYKDGDYNRGRAHKLFSEAEEKMKRRAYWSALARYRAINFPEGIIEASLRLDDDERILRYFFDEDRFDLIEEYIEHRESLNLSKDFLAYLIDKQRKGIWFFMDSKIEDSIIKIFYLHIRAYPNEDSRKIINDYLFWLIITPRILIGLTDTLFKLILEVKNYNIVFTILEDIEFRRSSPDKLKNFLKLIEKRAGENNDPNLLACSMYDKDRKAFNSALEELPVTELNYKLFLANKENYQRAIDFLVSSDNLKEAALGCLKNNDFIQTASIYEISEDYRSAARVYRQIESYGDAARCFLKAGDKKAAARMYKKMGKLDKAKEIWDSLRLSRKRKSKVDGDNQLKLF